MRRVEEHKAARLAEMVKGVKAGKGKGKAEDESSSHGGSEAQATKGATRKNLSGIILRG